MTAGINPAQKRLDQLMQEGGVDPLELAFIQQQLGQWSSDHRREGGLLKGWNHIAITPICKMAARASVSIRKAGATDNRAEDSDRGAALPQSHPLYRLVTNPNPWSTGAIYRWEVVQQLHLHGQALVWRVRGDNGFTKYRICIPMALTQPFAAGRHADYPAGGIQVRPIESVDYQRFSIQANYGALRFVSGRYIGVDDLILYRYPHPFIRSDGHSPTYAGAEWIELSQAIDEQRGKDIEGGSGAKTLVTPPAEANNSTDELNTYQRRLNERYKSGDKLIAVAHGSGTITSFNAEEMGYSEAFNQLGDATMALHGTSKAAAGLQDQMTYGALAAAMDAFNVIAVQPDLDIIADEDTATIGAEYGDGITIEYKAPEIANPELDETKLGNDVMAGALTVGEYRERRGMKPHGDERDNLIAGSVAAKEWQPSQERNHFRELLSAGRSGGSTESANAGPSARPDGLNEAQITAAIGVLEKIGADQLAEDAAVELLSQVGIDEQKAKQIIASQKREVIPGTQAKALRKSLFSNQASRPYVIAVDLDGTLAEYDGVYDELSIGEPREGAVAAMRALHKAGAKIVIFTVRDDDQLISEWLVSNGIPFDAINENPWSNSTSGKVMADLYWDDRAVSAEGPMTQRLADLAKSIRSKSVRDKLNDQLIGKFFKANRGYLYLPIEGKAEQLVRSEAAKLDQAVVVETEHMPHVTVLPFVMDATADEVVTLIRPAGQFHVRFGEIGVFEATDERPTDVVYITINSPELEELHGVVSEHLPHVSSHHQYRPHVTLGYVNPGEGQQYIGASELTGTAFHVRRLVYVPPGETPVIIPLREFRQELNGRAKAFLQN